jgi:hypothetical protein
MGRTTAQLSKVEIERLFFFPRQSSSTCSPESSFSFAYFLAS